MFRDVSALEAREIVKNKEVIVLDVRTPKEFRQDHFHHAINIDFYAEDFKEKLTQLDRFKVYLVHCHSGRRSTKTVQLMEQMGFKGGFNVKGVLFD
jgi:rhodanese-related sulfurtransferase